MSWGYLFCCDFVSSQTHLLIHFLKLSWRQKSIKFSRADSGVKWFISSDVSETNSISIIRAMRNNASVSIRLCLWNKIWCFVVEIPGRISYVRHLDEKYLSEVRVTVSVHSCVSPLLYYGKQKKLLYTPACPCQVQGGTILSAGVWWLWQLSFRMVWHLNIARIHPSWQAR